MSAPNTNVEKQTRRHKPSLLAIAAVVGFAALLGAVIVGMLPDRDDASASEPAISTSD